MSERPLLEIITRTHKRPAMLAVNKASLYTQTEGDWLQTFLVDDVGRGMGWAQAQLADFDPQGQYVWILDDDNAAAITSLVADVRRIAAEHDPDVIMVRTDRGRVIPGDRLWGQRPQGGHVDAACAIVKRARWLRHSGAWKSARYESDFDFIDALFEGGATVYWHDVVASYAQRVSHGAPE